MQSGLGAKGMFLHIFYWIVLALAAAPLAYYLLSLYCVIGYFHELRKSHPLTSTFAPPASILKPVRGVDHEAYENFASYCRLDYPEYEIIFAVAEPDDPVVPVIERLQSDFPDCPIRLVKGVARVGANRKVNSLCRLVHEAKYDLVVMSDSDVRVEPDYLRVATAPLSDSEVGAVTAFYRCRTNGGVAADLDALGMCLDSAPGALVARRLENAVRLRLDDGDHQETPWGDRRVGRDGEFSFRRFRAREQDCAPRVSRRADAEAGVDGVSTRDDQTACWS